MPPDRKLELVLVQPALQVLAAAEQDFPVDRVDDLKDPRLLGGFLVLPLNLGAFFDW